MAPVLNGFFKLLFLYIEPILTLGGAYSAFTTPEWYLTNLTPGPTITGLLHTTETNMAIRLYGVLLFLLAIISISIFSLIASHTDALSISVAKRLLFVLAGMAPVFDGGDCSGGFGASLCYCDSFGMGDLFGC
jgi:hypothetical protein